MNDMNSGNSNKINDHDTKKDNCYEQSDINIGCFNNINIIAIKTNVVKSKVPSSSPTASYRQR